MKPDIDVGVVLPTRNSMPHIKEHVKALNTWIHKVREVIVVDSESTDGTVEYIREHLLHPKTIFLNHPPGLYKSWNEGIRHIHSEYTYIATVNDYMPFETLHCLYLAANKFDADVVVSAPDYISEERMCEHRKWPIHCFLEATAISDSHLLHPLELLAWNSIDLPGTMIGSSASNLYRTSSLQENLFPCDYGHAGDSAWALGTSLNSRWVVVPKVKSNFLYHGGENLSGGNGRQLRSKLHLLAKSQMSSFKSSLSMSDQEKRLLKSLNELADLWQDKENVTFGFQDYRERRIPWFLFYHAWKLRAARKNSNLSIFAQKRQILSLLEELY